MGKCPSFFAWGNLRSLNACDAEEADALKRVPTGLYGPLKRAQDATAVLLTSCRMKKSKIISGSLPHDTAR
jgi:hypothetical protein